jgi:hypothetical protein
LAIRQKLERAEHPWLGLALQVSAYCDADSRAEGYLLNEVFKGANPFGLGKSETQAKEEM